MSATRKDEADRREHPPQTVLRRHQPPEIEAQFWAMLTSGVMAEWTEIVAPDPAARAH